MASLRLRCSESRDRIDKSWRKSEPATRKALVSVDLINVGFHISALGCDAAVLRRYPGSASQDSINPESGCVIFRFTDHLRLCDSGMHKESSRTSPWTRSWREFQFPKAYRSVAVLT